MALHCANSNREREIERKLLTSVHLNYKDIPLKQIVDSLSSLNDMNIVPDVNALEEASISLDQPLSLKVDGISLRIR